MPVTGVEGVAGLETGVAGVDARAEVDIFDLIMRYYLALLKTFACVSSECIFLGCQQTIRELLYLQKNLLQAFFLLHLLIPRG